MTINERIEAAIEARAAEIDWKLSSAARYMDAEHVEASRARSDTFREAARIARETSPWVAVADGLPTRDGRYLVHCPSADPDSPLISVAWYHPEEGSWSLLPQMWIDAITHWMDVPGPPLPIGGGDRG